MANRGRPSKQIEEKKVEYLMIRLESDEKQTFKDAAKIFGISLSGWVRERLRQAAIKELDSVGHEITLFKRINLR